VLFKRYEKFCASLELTLPLKEAARNYIRRTRGAELSRLSPNASGEDLFHHKF